MKLRLTLLLAMFVCAVSLVIVGVKAQNHGSQEHEGDDAPDVMDKRPHHLHDHHQDAVTKGSTGVVTPAITYHGGALINTPTIYIVWYGNWNQSNGSDTPSGQQIVRDFANSIGGSAYFKINTTYNAGGYAVSGNVAFGGETTDTGSRGTRPARFRHQDHRDERDQFKQTAI